MKNSQASRTVADAGKATVLSTMMSDKVVPGGLRTSRLVGTTPRRRPSSSTT